MPKIAFLQSLALEYTYAALPAGRKGNRSMLRVQNVFTLDLSPLEFSFATDPLLIGGKAMEYYGLRQAGADIDLVITSDDYRQLSAQYPEALRDLWGDLGVCPLNFEIWQTIMLYDYAFWSAGAVQEDGYRVISLEKLLYSRVLAMHLEKYRRDLDLVKNRLLQEHLPQRVQYLPHGCLGQYVRHADLVCLAEVMPEQDQTCQAVVQEVWQARTAVSAGDRLTLTLPRELGSGLCLLFLSSAGKHSQYQPMAGLQGAAVIRAEVLQHAEPAGALGRELHQQPLELIRQKVSRIISELKL